MPRKYKSLEGSEGRANAPKSMYERLRSTLKKKKKDKGFTQIDEIDVTMNPVALAPPDEVAVARTGAAASSLPAARASAATNVGTYSPFHSVGKGLANVDSATLDQVFDKVSELELKDIPPPVLKLSAGMLMGADMLNAMDGVDEDISNPLHKGKKDKGNKVNIEMKGKKSAAPAAFPVELPIDDLRSNIAIIEPSEFEAAVTEIKPEFEKKMKEIKELLRKGWISSGHNVSERWRNVVCILLVVMGLIYRYAFAAAGRGASGRGKKTRRKKAKKRSYKKHHKKNHKKTHKKH